MQVTCGSCRYPYFPLHAGKVKLRGTELELSNLEVEYLDDHMYYRPPLSLSADHGLGNGVSRTQPGCFQGHEEKTEKMDIQRGCASLTRSIIHGLRSTLKTDPCAVPDRRYIRRRLQQGPKREAPASG